MWDRRGLHQLHYRDFQAFSTRRVLIHLWAEVPDLISYSPFVDPIEQCPDLGGPVAGMLSKVLEEKP